MIMFGSKTQDMLTFKSKEQSLLATAPSRIMTHIQYHVEATNSWYQIHLCHDRLYWSLNGMAKVVRDSPQAVRLEG